MIYGKDALQWFRNNKDMLIAKISLDSAEEVDVFPSHLVPQRFCEVRKELMEESIACAAVFGKYFKYVWGNGEIVRGFNGFLAQFGRLPVKEDKFTVYKRTLLENDVIIAIEFNDD